MKEDDILLSCKSMCIGTSLAVVVSWSVNESILWAMLHGVFSWAYIIYYCVMGDL
ncbi:MAG: hypothetical protein ACI9HU_001386 [Colwellia sp.]|jgi:hypothetical protein